MYGKSYHDGEGHNVTLYIRILSALISPVHQSLLIVHLDRSSCQQPHSVLPGDHVLALVVHVAGEGDILAYLDLEMLLLRVKCWLLLLLLLLSLSFVVCLINQVGVHILRVCHTFNQKDFKYF